MRPLEDFVVEVKKRFNDQYTMSNGDVIYIETKYDEFGNRSIEGKVIATPYKYNTGVQPGDTMYFHHHVVIQKAQPIPLEDAKNQYIVKYNEEQTLACQAIAYKCRETGELKTLGGWLLLEKIEEEKEKDNHLGIEIVELTNKPVNKGRFIKHNKNSDHLDIEEGEVVYFRSGIAYEMVIDGKHYLRMRPEDLLYTMKDGEV